MSRRTTAWREQSGFTLLELMISIAILGLILVALTGGLHFAGRAWQTQERQADRLGDINAVQNALRQIIATGFAFEGDSASLKFVGKLPIALERGGLYDIQMLVVDDRLTLSWRPHFKGVASLDERGATLLNRVENVQLAYYSSPQGWKNSTKGKDKAPQLISLTVQLEAHQPWPTLVVAPAINLAPANDS